MKKTVTLFSALILPLCWLLFSFNLLGQGNKFSTAKGFKEYVFGVSPNVYKNLKLEISEGNTRLYSLDQTNIQIDGVEMNWVRLTFTKNKLSAISVQSKNSSGIKLLQNLKESYGEPTRISASKKSYEWVNEQMDFLYESNLSGADATVSFTCKKMFN